MALFGVDGVRPGAHAGLGATFSLAPRFGVQVEAAVEHFPTMPEPTDRTFVLVGAGVQWRPL
jgi:hypothetical protein